MKINIIIISVILCACLLFFREIFIPGKVPIPADTVIGLYHPFRDLYSQDYPRGLPFKNFLITDPVRQQYPWRNISVELFSNFQLPLWNPYNFSGTPLLANFQSAVFYPLNILLLIMPFTYGWTVLVLLQPLFGAIFMFMYLRYLKLDKMAVLLGSIVFGLSGSSIVWLEWNTVGHTLLWLPLILLAKEHLISKKSYKWLVVLVFAEVSAIFAGHLQTLFYVFLISNTYLFLRLWQSNKKIISVLYAYRIFIFAGAFVFLLTAIQWVPTFQFILLSARNVDQSMMQEGWFIPIKHLIQFISPDFFGNPATLNYWGTWNYLEFVGYISILPLIMAFYALLYRREFSVLFFGIVLIISLLFATDNIIARIPYVLNIPLLATSQPTRLVLIADFALAILAAFGLDYWIKTKNKKYIPFVLLLVIFSGLWFSVLYNQFNIPLESLLVAKRNLILPTLIFVISTVLLLAHIISKNAVVSKIIIGVLITIVFYDLARFGDKFLPFVQREYVFPQTKTIEFLQKNVGNHRIMSVDNRILPPNFSVMYKLQTVEGYDPLYLRRYGELIAASERGKADINPPFGFNRIITPKNYNSSIIDLLGVKYILSLSDISSSKLKKVFQEGDTRIYENIQVMPRTFFVKKLISQTAREEEIKELFSQDLRSVAVVQSRKNIPYESMYSVGIASIINYSENKIVIKTYNEGDGFLVLTDSYYPSWKATINGTPTDILISDYNYRGIFVPKGDNIIEFNNALF